MNVSVYSPLVRIALDDGLVLGTGFGDRFEAIRGGSGRLEEGPAWVRKLACMQEKAGRKPFFSDSPPQPESSMVRRGSAVRVRQRV